MLVYDDNSSLLYKTPCCNTKLVLCVMSLQPPLALGNIIFIIYRKMHPDMRLHPTKDHFITGQGVVLQFKDHCIMLLHQ